ncbi:phosphonate ABC transporter ATP-binding protein [Streptomyces avicenniae]|uniref:phosphonate ABC transporter ATP-binding protein n=1 Tax=Streptomyces avicenniae TaxID=500153 RepID=UPI000ADEBC79|nr:ATP-binding cassette domain-containing protein [Streptomyces avicenniae]
MTTATPDTTTAALSVRGLRKTFAGRTVLDGIDLDVRAGELVAVLGANGSGKSTALRCVIGLERPDAGSVRLHGEETAGQAGRRPAAVSRRAAMVFQHIHLVPRRSALDNVCAGALGRLPLRRSLTPLLFPRELREEAMACLARVGLADRAGEAVARLSGGQQQRVAVARALCQRADVLLADEPVASLDPAATTQVLDLLGVLARDEGLAVAAVLHQPALARRHADRIVGLRGGGLVIDAPAGDVPASALDDLYSHGPGPEGTTP